MDRRWHWRLHYNCFIGSEFTTWLLQNFKDIDTREEAVEFGNELMKHGLFQHVEQRHNFRDGNYFYQIAAEYRVARPPESRSGWFPARKPEKSVPSTPSGETAKDAPSGEHTRSDSRDEAATSVPIAEASAIVKMQPFRKLYRVKLKVEPPEPPAPLSFNATSFSQQGKPDKHYYQKAILKKFDFVLDFEAASDFPPDVEVFYSWGKPDYRYPQYIHRSGCLLAQISDEGDLLFLANRLFSTKGAGRDKFDRGDRNEQYHRPRAGTYTYDPMFSPRLSPVVRPVPEPNVNAGPGGINASNTIDTANLYRTPEYLKNQVEEFCNDEVRLQQFYNEVQVRPLSTRVGPTVPPSTSSTMESSIPSLELPASVVAHHYSSAAVESENNNNNNNNPLMEAANTSIDPRTTPTMAPQRDSAKDGPRSGDLKPVH
ncbi:Vacuolar membrane-associated protein iml1 [Rasamsonia emersonii CBS 393.64]|uniref:Vacuolar membrane-associated protein IML1 n=1 Tax=Rasamsonia emersonii (strain ATCC 16479 / CBS 393.64 / IMI 116815) TaxID=1408163 RepID=A0A0F4YE54_RASE3|nr:Vacuolar membrane-associated protein iml1 [Rasamsonia emersonii CBS 393.64]KKA16196.1 Vacuolar membrane-associated protein iml1 [Rasamsonia emersonii CBS 393.64]